MNEYNFLDCSPTEKLAQTSMSVWKLQRYARNTAPIPRAAIIVNVMRNTMNAKRMSIHANARITYHHG